MGRSPSCDNHGLKKGPWTTEEDKKLVDYIERHGHGSWRALPKLAGLNRCGKSCRLRWTNYLRPDIKRGKFSQEEEQTIINLHSLLGNKWSAIAGHLPGRTDNEIKNYWNTHLKKRLLQMGIDPVTHRPRTDLTMLANFAAQNINSLDNTGTQLAKLQLLQNIFHVLVGTNDLNLNPNPVHPVAGTLLDPNAALFGPSVAQNMVYHDHQPLDCLLQRISAQPAEGITNTAPFHPCRNDEFVNATSSVFGYVEPEAAETGNHMPALVPASPDFNPSVNQTQRKTTLNGNKKNEASNPCSTITTNNTTFDVWSEIMDEEGGNSYWRDIIDQESPPSWPITS